MHVYSAYLIREDKLPKLKMEWFILLQELIDAALVLSYIYLDGGVESPVFGAIILLIVMVGLLVPLKLSLLYAAICSAVYMTILLLELYEVIPHQFVRVQEDLHLNQEVVFSDGLFIVAIFFVIAYVSHYLTKEAGLVE